MTTEHGTDEQEIDPDSTLIQRAIHARRQGQALSDPGLDTDDQQLVNDMLPWLDAVQQMVLEHDSDAEPRAPKHVPVRADDPVALMLGLVPDPAVVVNGCKLAAARKRAQLDLGQLVSRDGGHFTRHSQVSAAQQLINLRQRVNGAALPDTSRSSPAPRMGDNH